MAGQNMNVVIYQADGKIPNIAVMRIAAHHRAGGDDVEVRWGTRRFMWDRFDRIYVSAIFEKSRHRVRQLLIDYPNAIVGGTGWDVASSLESIGIFSNRQDYSDYPNWKQSIGFTQRGCRLGCKFCVVPRKEGKVFEVQTIWDLWRGDPWPRDLIILDNDFFGQPNWSSRIDEIKSGNFRVSFCQGINARMLTDDAAAAIASIRYYDDQFKTKRIYTAWDNLADEKRLFAGLESLVKHGVRPDHIMVYVLIGYWPGETDESWEHRRAKLREFGVRPYPMPFVRTDLTRGFQRFVVGAYDKRISWNEWKAAQCRPERLLGGSR